MTSPPITEATEAKVISKGRLILGGTIFIGGLLTPLLIPLVISSNLSDEVKTFLSGALALGVPEVGILIAVMVLGKAGYAQFKKILLNFLKKNFAPPQKVSLVRYRIGLAMICVPILVGWLGPYFSELIFETESLNMYIFIAGDLLFVAGLFVLGGEFWDKLHALFRHDASVNIPSQEN